jgi:hypothetical protein
VLAPAAAKLDSSFSRADPTVHVDLAVAYGLRDDIELARCHLQQQFK